MCTSTRYGWPGRARRDQPRPQRSRSPFSTISSSDFQSVRGWTIEGKREHDYAAIILPADQAVPEIGHLGFAVYDASGLLGTYLNVAGYPADNSATRINHEVFANLERWVALGA